MTSMLPLSSLHSAPVATVALSTIPNSTEALTSELTLLAGHINAAQYRFLKLLAALIERNAWGGDSGMKTPAHWLNYYCGIDLGAAREKVRVAKALQSLPQIDEAFASGALSYSKVRAMTRSATPDNEAVLLNVAKHGTAQHVENLVRLYRRAERLQQKSSDANQTQHEARELTWYFDEDGMLVMKGRFAPEEGAVVVKALEAALDSFSQEQDIDVSAETSERHAPETTFPRKRADALVQLAEQFLASDQHDPVHAYPRCSNSDKYQIFVHFDARSGSELRRMRMPAHLDEGPPLPDSTFKRLACDTSLVPVLRDDTGNVLNIGRKTRAVPPALRRALKIRDGGCRHPGCCQTRHVDAHHIKHWCDGGETSLDNLVLLCRHHHRMLHENVFSIAKAGDGKKILLFLDKHGKEIKRALWPQFATPSTGSDGKIEIERDHARLGLDIDAETAVTLWQGERMDYGMAITTGDSHSFKV